MASRSVAQPLKLDPVAEAVAMPRKPITPMTRFEVFKRDKFTCQYCGEKSPDTVLHVDHIEPVAEGGDNDMMNLITSCATCNGGKGPRRLSDESALQRQRQQMEELQDRREQVELMARWRRELLALEGDQEKEAADLWSTLLDGLSSLTDAGHRDLRKLARKFSWSEVMTAMPIAIDTYVKWREEGPQGASVAVAFGKLGGICHNTRRQTENPELEFLYRTRSLWRSRHGDDRWYVMPLLQEAARCGWGPREIFELALRTWRWSDFEEELETFIEENGGTLP